MAPHQVRVLLLQTQDSFIGLDDRGRGLIKLPDSDIILSDDTIRAKTLLFTPCCLANSLFAITRGEAPSLKVDASPAGTVPVPSQMKAGFKAFILSAQSSSNPSSLDTMMSPSTSTQPAAGPVDYVLQQVVIAVTSSSSRTAPTTARTILILRALCGKSSNGHGTQRLRHACFPRPPRTKTDHPILRTLLQKHSTLVGSSIPSIHALVMTCTALLAILSFLAAPPELALPGFIRILG